MNFRAGYVLPRVLVVLFFLDVLFRFVPLSVFGLRTAGGESRRLFNVVGPFAPNIQIKTASVFGDLANLGNLPRMREYRSSTFTTDSLGFNNPFHLNSAPKVIFLGDSFALPDDVSEARTFSSRLGTLLGHPVFNAGGTVPLRLAPLQDLSHQLGMKEGFVLYEFLERHLMEAPPLNTPTGSNNLQSLPSRIFGVRRWEEIRLPIWNYLVFSPLQAIAQKVDKSLCNDILLPNRYTQNVLIRSMKNGDNLLFLAQDLTAQQATEKNVAAWAKYFEWYSNQLKQDGLKLVVLLIPNKYTVYAPSFSIPEDVRANERNLRGLESFLRQQQIPIVSLLDPFREQALKDEDRHLYLYWNDDTHWNERGMAKAAGLVAEEISRQEFTGISAGFDSH
jgi:hypothetical protein